MLGRPWFVTFIFTFPSLFPSLPLHMSSKAMAKKGMAGDAQEGNEGLGKEGGRGRLGANSWGLEADRSIWSTTGRRHQEIPGSGCEYGCHAAWYVRNGIYLPLAPIFPPSLSDLLLTQVCQTAASPCGMCRQLYVCSYNPLRQIPLTLVHFPPFPLSFPIDGIIPRHTNIMMVLKLCAYLIQHPRVLLPFHAYHHVG